MTWTNACPPNPQQILYPREPSITWVGLKPAEAGLVNLNNTCFLNSSLQALLHLPSFVEFLENDTAHRQKCFSLLSCIVCALYRTYLNMSLHPIFRPTGLVNLLPRLNKNFKIGKQEDAHEFSMFLLSSVEEHLVGRCGLLKLDYCSRQTTAIGRIFAGWMETSDVCTDCEKIEKKYGPISLLTLPVVSGSVQQAVNDTLDKDELICDYQCTEKCLSKQCTRSIEYYQYPKVLRIVLNRFDNYGEKILTPMHLDKVLNVGKATYHFISAVVHEGETPNEGHYTSLCVRSDGKIMHYNDAVVTDGIRFMNSSKTSRGVYLAYYQLHHFKPVSLKRSPPCTPSKAISPQRKKQNVGSVKKSLEKKTKGKMLTFSPRKFKRKIGDLFRSVLPLKPKTTNNHGDADGLTKPSHAVNCVPPERCEAPQASQCKQIKHSENVPPVQTAIVSPVKVDIPQIIARRKRSLVMGRSFPASPCNESIKVTDSEATVSAIATPIKAELVLKSGKENSTSTLSKPEEFINDTDSEATLSAIDTPIKASTLSKPEEFINDTDSEATLSAIDTPVKIKLCQNPEKQHRTSAASHPKKTMKPLVLTPVPTTPTSHKKRDNVITDIVTPNGAMCEIEKTPARRLFTPPRPEMDQFEAPESPLITFENPLTLSGAEKKLLNDDDDDDDDDKWRKEIMKRILCDVNPEDIQSRISLHPEPNIITDGGDAPGPSINQQSPILQPEHETEPNIITDGGDAPDPFINHVSTFVPVQLTADDVTDSHLPNPTIEKNTVKQLKRWLRLRGLPTTGNKPALIKMVKDCFAMKRDKFIDPKADAGKLYDDKRQRLQLTQDIACLDSNKIFPSHGWSVFPSRDIPNNFNFGSVYHYLVETMPQLEDVFRAEDSTLSDAESSGDEEEENITTLTDPFQDAECKAIKHCKKLRRGLQYVKSGYVRNVQDCWPDRVHIYQAEVRASMNSEAYSVKVALSPLSGSIVKCTCDKMCPQKSLGRCSHISALLLFILLHKNLNGPGAITCTSRPCTWNKGSLKRNPAVANQRQYESFKINVLRRANFDPRPTKHQSGYPSTFIKNNFLCELSYKETPCLFQTMMSLQYENFDYDREELFIIRQKRYQFYMALQQQLLSFQPCPQHKGPFEVNETKTQSKSLTWIRLRALRCTAEPSHRIANFQTNSAKKNFLQKHLWGMNQITTKAMSYGRTHEAEARQKYAEEQLNKDVTAVVEQCGLYLNPRFLGLSCSPDGIKKSEIHTHPEILLEIKCLYSLRGKDPNKFETILTKKQLAQFCLSKTTDGKIILKKNHAYYDQVQFSLGLMNLPECDFFVWSKVGSITVTVPFDERRWLHLQNKLSAFHSEYLVPEYFAKRTPRELDPIRIPK